jgi:hypothetical protein
LIIGLIIYATLLAVPFAFQAVITIPRVRAWNIIGTSCITIIARFLGHNRGIHSQGMFYQMKTRVQVNGSDGDLNGGITNGAVHERSIHVVVVKDNTDAPHFLAVQYLIRELHFAARDETDEIFGAILHAVADEAELAINERPCDLAVGCIQHGQVVGLSYGTTNNRTITIIVHIQAVHLDRTFHEVIALSVAYRCAILLGGLKLQT